MPPCALKNTGAAGIMEYGLNQLAINRKTILNWMSKIGEIQAIQVTDERGFREEVKCEMVNLDSAEFDFKFEKTSFYKKNVEIFARQAILPEIVIHNEQGMPDVIANIGDWIVNNPKANDPRKRMALTCSIRRIACRSASLSTTRPAW